MFQNWGLILDTISAILESHAERICCRTGSSKCTTTPAPTATSKKVSCTWCRPFWRIVTDLDSWPVERSTWMVDLRPTSKRVNLSMPNPRFFRGDGFFSQYLYRNLSNRSKNRRTECLKVKRKSSRWFPFWNLDAPTVLFSDANASDRRPTDLIRPCPPASERWTRSPSATDGSRSALKCPPVTGSGQVSSSIEKKNNCWLRLG